MKSDPILYDYWPYMDRPKIVWPGGKKLAFWVAPNIEFYELNPPSNPQRKAWPRPYPDIAGYSYRDHGNRVGHWRLMEAMDACGIRGSVSLSTAMCQHHPDIIEACNERNWEFFSHGIYNTRYTYGMSRAQEDAMIKDSIETVFKATGQRVRGYLAPALTHSEHTIELLAENDIWYSCDLFQDDQPQPLKTQTPSKLISMPYSLEVNDHYAFNVYGQSAQQYADLLKRHFDQLLSEGAQSGTVMCIPIHAYLIGRAHRIDPFKEVLEYITAHKKDVWVTTAAEIAEYYRENCYTDALRSIASADWRDI
jgi:peptidoglycan/xylan/chitin deacetylase (PgdA/CDA1 family)